MNDEKVAALTSQVNSIQSNMAMKSDIHLIDQKIESRFESIVVYSGKVDKLVDVVNRLIVVQERREEADTHREKENERLRADVDKLKSNDQKFREFIAVDKPRREAMAIAKKVIIGIVVGAAFWAVFQIKH